MGFKIIGTGSRTPDRIITNDDLSTIMDTSDEWIRTRTGICERHVMEDGEGLVNMAEAAAKRAIEMSGISPADIGVVICSTLRGDNVTPSIAPIVAGKLGVPSGAVVFDLNMACCGYIFAMNAAGSYLSSGCFKYALVIAAEGMSRLVDWSDRSTCVLFGDAAGAAVLEASDVNPVDFDFCTESNDTVLKIRRGADNCPYNTYSDPGVLAMNGQEVYKFAVSAVVDRIETLLQRNGLSTGDISKILLHQANFRIIASAQNRLGGSPEQFPTNIEHYGNTSSATLPVLLDELCRAESLRDGDKLIFCAFGAGLTSAACLLTWHI